MGLPPGSKYTAYITLRIAPDLKGRLDEIAEREERSIVQVVRLILRDALMKKKKATSGRGKEDKYDRLR